LHLSIISGPQNKLFTMQDFHLQGRTFCSIVIMARAMFSCLRVHGSSCAAPAVSKTIAGVFMLFPRILKTLNIQLSTFNERTNGEALGVRR
jgi:hypothetical protein